MERIRQGRTVDRGRPTRRGVLRTGGLLLGALSAPALLSACGTNAAADGAGNVLRATVLRTPRHPYTRQLLDAVPVLDPRRGRRAADRVSLTSEESR